MMLLREEGSSIGCGLNADDEAQQLDLYKGVIAAVADELVGVLEIADEAEDEVDACSRVLCQYLCVLSFIEGGMASSGGTVYVDVDVLHEEEYQSCCSVEVLGDGVSGCCLFDGKEEVQQVWPWW